MALAKDASRLIEKSEGQNTRRAYRSDWQLYASFCGQNGITPLPSPPEAVLLFLADQHSTQGRKWSTIQRRIAAIRRAHLDAGLASPTAHPQVAKILKGIRLEQGTPRSPAPFISARDLCAACDRIEQHSRENPLAAARDRALLLMGFSSAMRREELGAIDVEHLQFSHEGLTLHIPHSKTDKRAEGQTISIPREPNPRYCPIAALEKWLNLAELTSGPVFRSLARGKLRRERLNRARDAVQVPRMSGKDVARVLQTYLGTAPNGKRYSPHGMRSGFVTESLQAGHSIENVMLRTRHRDYNTLLSYRAQADAFKNPAGVGLLSPKKPE